MKCDSLAFLYCGLLLFIFSRTENVMWSMLWPGRLKCAPVAWSSLRFLT